MKPLALAFAIVAVSGSVMAGGYSEPAYEPEVTAPPAPEIVQEVEQAGGSSSSGIVVPLLILALVGLAAS